MPGARAAAPDGSRHGGARPDGPPADGSPAHEGVAPMAIRVVVTGRTVVPTGAPAGRSVDATTLVPLVGAVVGSPTTAAFHTSTGSSAPPAPAALSGAAAPASSGTGSPSPATPPPAPPPPPVAAPAPGVTVHANAAGLSATRRPATSAEATRRPATSAEAAPLPRRIPPTPADAPASAGLRAPHAAGTLTLSADGAYAARLTRGGSEALGRGWYPERWTLDGPEPYAVPLPLDQPEEPDSQVVPLADGRVLIRRRVADRHAFSLLYPTGPGTGELPLGSVECERMTLIAPAPDGASVYALAPGIFTTSVWRVAGGAFGPEHVADVPGLCSGGVWLDRTGRVLALDRRPPGGGPVKTVAVDLERGGEVTPLLQIAPGSNDRLLIAEPDSGLFLLRSDAPGRDRLGWGILGSALPVRFPECLCPADVTVTPFAVQPGQMLMPESCAVALRIDGAAGSWLGVWRPTGRRLHQFVAPTGWQTGSGSWSRDGVLSLPYARPDAPCGLARLEAPEDAPPQAYDGVRRGPGPADETGTQPSAAGSSPVECRPVPLGQVYPRSGPAPG
ncbi:hypothetical protein [Streptomyces sp. NPDC060198]|uniref:hypothetical protein n=1 Tax=Streptomyces sp. NPDC060198 TaxID=3347070 RepID=UPI00365FD158